MYFSRQYPRTKFHYRPHPQRRPPIPSPTNNPNVSCRLRPPSLLSSAPPPSPHTHLDYPVPSPLHINHHPSSIHTKPTNSPPRTSTPHHTSPHLTHKATSANPFSHPPAPLISAPPDLTNIYLSNTPQPPHGPLPPPPLLLLLVLTSTPTTRPISSAPTRQHQPSPEPQHHHSSLLSLSSPFLLSFTSTHHGHSNHPSCSFPPLPTTVPHSPVHSLTLRTSSPHNIPHRPPMPTEMTKWNQWLVSRGGK